MIILVIISYILLISGAIFSIIGGLGIVRLPEFYSRLHGGGITDTLGASLIIFGLMCQAGSLLVAAKLLMILFFLLVTSPTSCHALAKSAMNQGVRPIVDKPNQRTSGAGK